ncbi:MAG: LysM peptidoglycan-binding domain-containing protein [Candidatus Azambacteria bacterium]|nr:LysM peptidoglycan-binding domain-containing protein [Candidatus Azambacteria bacterium]
MHEVIEETREGRSDSYLNLIYTMISNFLSALRRGINTLIAKFPVLSTGNRFFYILAFAKKNVFSVVFVIMLLFASFFNLADANGKLSAMTLTTIQQNAENTYTEVSLKSSQGYISKEAVYDSIDDGRGGIAEEEADEYAYPTTADDALIADFAPLTIDQNQTSRDQIVYYVVESGDTISGIATQFSVAPTTLLWANNLSSVDYIKEGQRLEVLPVDGLKYTVKKGDTVSSLAQQFRASEDDIIEYNHLPADGALRVGDVLIVPDGRMPQPVRAPRSTVSLPSVAKTVSNKYFIFPTSGRITQGYHGANGVDIGNQCGTPIYAAADGIVTAVRTTASRASVGAAAYSGYGNNISITHPNGVVTLYAHLKDVFAFSGQEVKQGSMIATMGGGFEIVGGRRVRMEGAGRSTGCHLHFEVRGAKNPYLGR